MSVTTHGVYLVTDEDEFFLGSIDGILLGIYETGFPGKGMSFQTLVMDIVQGIISDPMKSSRTVTIEIRE